MWNFFETRPFFRADMAGLGKYHMADMAGSGSIGLKWEDCKAVSLPEPKYRYSHFVYFISEKTKLEDQWPKKEKRTSAGKGRERLQPIEGNTDNSLQKENTIGKLDF